MFCDTGIPCTFYGGKICSVLNNSALLCILYNFDTFREYCIEYGALYTGGNGRPKVIQNLNSATECRDRCIQENGCKYFTWKTGKRKNNCELRSNDNFEVKASRKGTSGNNF